MSVVLYSPSVNGFYNPNLSKGYMNRDVRYQIFISSTFNDLENERKDVIKSLIKFGYIPSGMEMFPSTDEEQFEYIKKQIDQSDIVVIILKGRYGTGYTEREYDYAISVGKPVLAFVYGPFGSIPLDLLDEEDVDRKRFIEFRNKVRDSRLVPSWNDSNELQLNILQSIDSYITDHPNIGWVKLDTLLDRSVIDDLLKENIELKKRVDELTASQTSDDILSGDDVITIPIKDNNGTQSVLDFTCNEVLRRFWSDFVSGVFDPRLDELISDWVKEKAGLCPSYGTISELKNIIIIQLEALGILDHYLADYDYHVSEDESFLINDCLGWIMRGEGLRKALYSLSIKKSNKDSGHSGDP